VITVCALFTDGLMDGRRTTKGNNNTAELKALSCAYK